MSKRVKVSKICLDIDGKKINLSLKQAQELKDVLEDMFGSNEVTAYRDRWLGYQPYWYTYTNGGSIVDKGNKTEVWNATCNSVEWDGKVSSGTLTLKAA